MLKKLLLIILGIGVIFVGFIVVKALASASDNLTFTEARILHSNAKSGAEALPLAESLIDEQKRLDLGKLSAKEAGKARMRMNTTKGFMKALGPEYRTVDLDEASTESVVKLILSINKDSIHAMQLKLKEMEAQAPNQSIFNKDSYPQWQRILTDDIDKLQRVNAVLLKKSHLT